VPVEPARKLEQVPYSRLVADIPENMSAQFSIAGRQIRALV